MENRELIGASGVGVRFALILGEQHTIVYVCVRLVDL